MTSAPLILVGAAGWLYPAWRGGFYPESLPDDWLLSYYNTQFSAVYLPAAVWQAVSAATWTQWLDDTQDGFHFVLEPGGETSIKPTSARVLLASPAWGAGHLWWLDDAPDLRALAQRITQQAATGEPLFAFSRSGNIVLMEQVNTLRQVMGY
jgi:hypothetical protein